MSATFNNYREKYDAQFGKYDLNNYFKQFINDDLDDHQIVTI